MHFLVTLYTKKFLLIKITYTQERVQRMFYNLFLTMGRKDISNIQHNANTL